MGKKTKIGIGSNNTSVVIADADQDTEATSPQDNNNGNAAVPVPLEQLVADYVPKINQVGAKGVMVWVETGKLVDDFAKVFRKHQYKGDAYKILAASQACAYQEKQLRYFAACYHLFCGLGEKAVEMPMTHYIVVLPQNLTYEEKGELLRAAHDEKLSVSELKERVSEMGKQKRRKKPVLNVKLAFEKEASHLFAVMLQVKKGDVANPQDAASNVGVVRDGLLPIIRMAVKYGYLHPQDLEMLLTDPKTDGAVRESQDREEVSATASEVVP